DKHLRDCLECRRQVQGWRSSMAALDAWQLPQPRQRPAFSSALRWAAAAAVVLALGFVIGRLTALSSRDLKKAQAALRSQMQSELAGAREELTRNLQLHRAELAQTIHAAAAVAATEETQELLDKFAKALDERREVDQETYLAALKQIEEQRLNDYATLR